MSKDDAPTFHVSPSFAKVLAICITGLVFWADWATDPDVNCGVFYACVLVILSWTQSVWWLWSWTALTIGLVSMDLVEDRSTFTRGEFINHLIAVAMLLVTATFVHFGMLLFRQLLGEIDERKRAEESLRGAKDELARVSRATTMGELAASIAHEVNQPLSGIVINGNACMRWLANVEGDSAHLTEARQATERIIRDGKRAGDVILRLRNFFKKADGQKVEVSINEIVKETKLLVGHESEKMKVKLHTQLAPNLPMVLGDPVQLQQVVLNLILNASESMAAVEDRVRTLIIRTGSEGSSHIYVEVEDSGVGIESKDLAKIFGAFYTTKLGGMGMGLSISRSIVESHNGKLSAKANDGPGTTFRFTISRK